jgi:hypothetical protein
MMNAQMTPRDWQLLSEYLDGQLSPRDRNKLEQRMVTQPELRDGLEELKQLRSVLRSVPRRKVPHNFTLTRAMVEKPAASRWTSWIPALSLSSAMATFLLIVSMLTRMPGGMPAAMVSPEMESSSRVMLAEPEMAIAEDSTAEDPPIILWGGPGSMADGRGGMGGGAEPPMMGSADPEMGLMAAPESEVYVDEGMPPPDEVIAESLPVEPEAAVEAPAEEPAAAPEMPAGEAPEVSAAREALVEENIEPLVGTGPILGVAPAEEQGAMQLKSAPAETEMLLAEQQQAQPAQPDMWLILQIALVLLAVGTGVTAIILKRKSKA